MMTVSNAAPTLTPISFPTSDVDIGAIIENVDIETLHGR